MKSSHRVEEMIAREQGSLEPIDHEATGKKLKEIQDYLSGLEIQTYNQGNKKWTRRASRRIGSLIRMLVGVKSDLEEQYATENEDWDVRTYFGR